MESAAHVPVAQEAQQLFEQLGIAEAASTRGGLEVRSPISGELLGSVAATSAEETRQRIQQAHHAFLAWRTVPAPRRGELIQIFGEELRAHRAELGRLVTLEAGKITTEGIGEVQEMIDICAFAAGLSRQL